MLTFAAALVTEPWSGIRLAPSNTFSSTFEQLEQLGWAAGQAQIGIASSSFWQKRLGLK